MTEGPKFGTHDGSQEQQMVEDPYCGPLPRGPKGTP